MTQTCFALYDGKQNLLIEEPLALRPNTRVKIIVEIDEARSRPAQDAKSNVFDFILAHSQHVGIADWAANHDHYLYGVPKRDDSENLH